MYKINKNITLEKFSLRGNYLTKKIFKKNSKQTLIFLRAPKHFNIGKHKVSSFVNFKKYNYYLNYKIPTNEFFKNKLFFYKIYNIFHKFHFLYILNSIKITTSLKIKW